jgi:hypothetical protein
MTARCGSGACLAPSRRATFSATRVAIHSAPVDLKMKDGDAKLAGTAEEIDDDDVKRSLRDSEQPSGPYHLFRCDVAELVVTSVAGDRLVIESWHPGRGVERRERA